MNSGKHSRKSVGCTLTALTLGALGFVWVTCMVALINSF